MGVIVIASDDLPDASDGKPLIFRGASGTSGDGAPPPAAGEPPPGGVEASALRKLNRRVLSLLFAVAMMCYIDRTNLAFASVSMTADLGFNAQVRIYHVCMQAWMRLHAVVAQPGRRAAAMECLVSRTLAHYFIPPGLRPRQRAFLCWVSRGLGEVKQLVFEALFRSSCSIR